MKPKFIRAFMDTALRFAQLSYARRLKVGAIVVKDDKIISIGYNGTPTGWDNNCEDKVYNTRFVKRSGGYWAEVDSAQLVDDKWMDENYPFEDEQGRYCLKTKSHVIHAESNALTKLAKTSGGADGSTVFITHAPCLECAKLIHQTGVAKVYWREIYRSDEGLKFLRDSGVRVEQVPPEDS